MSDPTIDEQIAWAESLVSDTRMPARLRGMHKAILSSLRILKKPDTNNLAGVCQLLSGLLERHHSNETAYSRSLRRSMSTCAEFRIDPIRALTESAYMEGLGKETAEALDHWKAISTDTAVT